MKYYRNDIRIPIIIVVISQLMTLIAIVFCILLLCILAIKNTLIPSRLFFCILVFKIILILLLAFLAKFQTKFERKTIKFIDHEALNRSILYGSLEDLETVHRMKIVEDDIGGIYIEGEDIILGSLKAERKCGIKDFKVEKILSNRFLGNYLIVRIGSDSLAFTPCSAFYSQPKSQADRVERAYDYLIEMLKENH
jgi:hypothetical protein